MVLNIAVIVPDVALYRHMHFAVWYYIKNNFYIIYYSIRKYTHLKYYWPQLPGNDTLIEITKYTRIQSIVIGKTIINLVAIWTVQNYPAQILKDNIRKNYRFIMI